MTPPGSVDKFRPVVAGGENRQSRRPGEGDADRIAETQFDSRALERSGEIRERPVVRTGR